MMMRMLSPFAGVSLLALASAAAAQTSPAGGRQTPTPTAGQAAEPGSDSNQAEDIIVTGIRQSLERAAEIKKSSTQIVDSIVAEDIGKFPDPTTAAALQRVPGVQVSVQQNNEISGVVVRGLPDILTTLDGREIFSTSNRNNSANSDMSGGRSFSFADLPAQALARVDVVKSQTADLIEGGIAGIVDLQLQRPFNFRKPTAILSARGIYGLRSDRIDGQYAGLLTDTWHTGIGDIGALINVSYQKTHYNHPRTRVGVRRGGAAVVAAPTGPLKFSLPGVLVPNVSANNGEYGQYSRPEANASLQWRASDNLQFYADGLYTGYRERSGASLYTANFFTNQTTVSNVVSNPDECYTARVAANGQNPLVVNGALQPFTLQTLCNLTSATFTAPITQQATTSTVARTDNYVGALGFKFEKDGSFLKGDFSYEKSTNIQEQITATVGRHVATWQYVRNTGDGTTNNVTPDPGSADGLVLNQGLTQDFSRATGSLYAARLDGGIAIDSVIKQFQFGARYADRSADFKRALVNTTAPGGVLGTSTENKAVLVSSTGLPADFLAPMPAVPGLNGGDQRALVPNPDFLNSAAGRDALRTVFGVPTGNPAYDPSRQFDASEKTLAFYAQAKYEVPIGGMTLDGVIGIRPTRTERTIAGNSLVTIPASGTTPARTITVPVNATTADIDILPNATARLQFGGGLQLRASFSKTIRRPNFTDLNPGITYTLTNNPNLLNAGSAGNPDLRPQKSDNYDASLEYYFGKGFFAVAVYKRDLVDRVVTAANSENIDGIIYAITRPRNVSSAELKGIEVSGQTFFDFLPGAFSGFGAFGNFTLADTKIKGNDPLVGRPLQGVSKYNYNAGLLYDKYGISGRLVYTWRSAYYDGDDTGTLGLRPLLDPSRANDPTYIPTLLNFVAPSGRLDASLSYDINKHIRVDLGATNITRARYDGYYERRYLSNQFRFDETTYSLGVRIGI